jgi:hypothetical protein
MIGGRARRGVTLADRDRLDTGVWLFERALYRAALTKVYKSRGGAFAIEPSPSPPAFVLQCVSLLLARVGSHPGRRRGPLSGVDPPPERWP